MKKILLAALLVLTTITVSAQSMRIWKGGSYQEFNTADIDSITFVDAQVTPDPDPVSSDDLVGTWMFYDDTSETTASDKWVFQETWIFRSDGSFEFSGKNWHNGVLHDDVYLKGPSYTYDKSTGALNLMVSQAQGDSDDEKYDGDPVAYPTLTATISGNKLYIDGIDGSDAKKSGYTRQ